MLEILAFVGSFDLVLLILSELSKSGRVFLQKNIHYLEKMLIKFAFKN